MLAANLSPPILVRRLTQVIRMPNLHAQLALLAHPQNVEGFRFRLEEDFWYVGQDQRADTAET